MGKQQKGANVKLLVGFQADIETPATAGFRLPVNTIGLRPEQALNQAQTLTGSRNPTQPFRGNKDVNGQIVIPVDSRAMFYWFKAIFGAPTTAGKTAAAWVGEQARDLGYLAIPTVSNGRYYEVTTAGTTGATQPTWPLAVGSTVADGTVVWTCRAFVHTFTIPDEQPYLTIEEQMTDLETPAYIRYLGCKIGSLQIDVGGDGELVATMDVLGADYEIAASAFDATPAVIALSRLANFQGQVSIDSGETKIATNMSLNLNNDLDGDQFVIGGQGVRGEIPEGIVGISGQFTTLFRDVALMEKAIAGEPVSLGLAFVRNDVSALAFEMQEVEFGVNAPQIQGPRGVRLELQYQAYHNEGAAASAVIARLTNVDQHAA